MIPSVRTVLYIVQLLAAESMFAFFLHRRRFFVLRAIAGLCVYLGIVLFIPNLLYAAIGEFLSMFISVISLPLLFFLFDNEWRAVLFFFISALLIQNLAYNVYLILSVSLQITEDGAIAWQNVTLGLAVYAVVYVIGMVLCAKRLKYRDYVSIDNGAIIFVSIAAIFMIYTLEYFLAKMGEESMLVCGLAFSCCDILCFILLYYMRVKYYLSEEKMVLEQLFDKKTEQNEIRQESIDLINMKYHDLKHQLALIYADERAANRLLCYDKMVRTGNKALDIILQEKELLCAEYKIRTSYLVDGAALEVMRPQDIASLFGNALDNSIEYLEKVPNEAKRFLSLTVGRKNNFVSIHIENYCETPPVFKAGLPVTTKPNKTEHGFGLKSIRYIVESYGGNMVIGVRDNLFCVDILLGGRKVS